MLTNKTTPSVGGKRTHEKNIVNSNNDELVSVITVIRNGEKNIRRCIDSVLKQTYSNCEHIIIDGASTDNTIAIIDGYGDKIEIWISEPDSGIYNALNKGINLSRGKFYVPLGCDDILLPTGIEKMMQHAKDNEIVYGKVQVRDKNGFPLNICRNHSAGMLIKKSAHAVYGLYDESYRIAADTKFLELVAKNGRSIKIEDVVGEFFLGGVSSDYGKVIIEHARAMQESGSWGRIKALSWLAPRIALNRMRGIFSRQL